MKKILLALLATVAILNVSAQSINMGPQKIKAHQVTSAAAPSKGNARTGIAHLDLDYNNVDAYVTLNVNSGSYFYSPWFMNSRYTIADTAGGLINPIDYYIVAYDTLFDYNSNSTYLPSDYNSIAVDSIVVVAGFANNSGNQDTMRVSLIKVGATGYPTSVVYWDSLFITGTGSTIDNKWDSVAAFVFFPNKTITDAHFAVKVEWFGDKVDTFTFRAGFPANPNANCNGGDGAAQTDYVYNVKAGKTSFKQGNSFAYWVNLAQPQLLPTSGGGDIFYDCDGDGDTTPDGSDGLNFIQNIFMFVAFDLNLSLSTNNINPDIAKAYVAPNPAADNTTLYFTMPNASVNSIINVTDLTGKVIYSENTGHLFAGKHTEQINTSNFASGIYMYSITTDRGTTYGKFVKQ